MSRIASAPAHGGLENLRFVDDEVLAQHRQRNCERTCVDGSASLGRISRRSKRTRRLRLLTRRILRSGRDRMPRQSCQRMATLFSPRQLNPVHPVPGCIAVAKPRKSLRCNAAARRCSARGSSFATSDFFWSRICWSRSLIAQQEIVSAQPCQRNEPALQRCNKEQGPESPGYFPADFVTISANAARVEARAADECAVDVGLAT